MLKNSGRKLLIGVVASTILSAATFSPVIVSAETQPTYNLLDRTGNPVLSRTGCVYVKNANDPAKPFEECGDIIDSDGDGVNDDKDECPNTPKGVEVDEKGCPVDSDGDGVADINDDCPNNTPREISRGVDASGCPKDSDLDGVPDYKDRCPGTPYGEAVDQYGCAVADVPRVEILSSDITFAFDSYRLTAQGQGELGSIVDQILSNFDKFSSVALTGHTDAIGSSRYNQTLSERRANAVKQFLVGRGIPVDQVSAQGKGESSPVASNSTREGRAQNRRVEVFVDMK
ncbi:OmpA family protein [Candidatus Albibeggiatoa sp. nov. NOAA]|uniref:OmpA family protein n=1 Tax=Candidatus Albibeggiatoa sp. nov. NOAA TaxID=3162724 RepID=UPI003300A28A|nr:OmpA family protein [Thiotrichaceae bacterium]